MAEVPPPGVEQPNTPPNPPVNPLYNGKGGRASVVAAVLGCSLLAIFFALDTLQYILVGHESDLFTAIAHGVGTVGILGIIGTVLKSYYFPRPNGK